jgi:hypothetical protein
MNRSFYANHLQFTWYGFDTFLYTAAHGNILVLFQPRVIIAIFFVAPIFLASKYGFKRSISAIVKKAETKEFIRDAVCTVNSVGLLLMLMDLLIIMGTLADGKETIGRHVATAQVSIIYAILASLLLSNKRLLDHSNENQTPYSPLPIQAAGAAGALMILIGVMWILGEA